MRTTTSVMALFLGFWTATATMAQAPVFLQVGADQEGQLESDDTLSYAIDLDAGHFVVGDVIQHTVDVVIGVDRPDGKRVATVDVSARGPEPFSFKTDTAGSFRINISPYQQQSGRFALRIRRVEPVATTPEGVVDQLMADFNGDDRPGGVAAVYRNGEVIFARGYGLANLTFPVPITPQTLFNIGSVSKQFAGIFFAMMAEEGRLSLDDDVRKYIPDFPDFGTPVRLRHLLNHTSGYREAYGVLGLQGRRVNGDILLRKDALDAVRRQPALQYPPGSRHLYNSTAYVILTEIAERITEQPYPEWMAEHVFGPLGMDNTRIEREPGDVIPGSATSYTFADAGGYREDFEAYAYYGATDVYTNVHDLARWLRNFRTSELGGPGVMQRMTERSLLSNGDTLGYTLGLSLDRHLGMKRIQHGGSTGGYRAFLAYYPEIDAGVVVLANTGAVPVTRIAEAAAAAFFSEHIRRMPAQPAPASPAEIDTVALDGYAGSYWAEGYGRIPIFREGTRLVIRPASGRADTLVALSDSSFWIDARLSILFDRSPSGVAEGATLSFRGQGDVPMRRLPASTGDDIGLGAFTGRYFSEEIESFYTAAVEDGKLTLEHRRLGKMPLEPRAPDLFTGPWPVREVAFERDPSGRVSGFRVVEGRTIGVRFERVE